VSATAQAAGPPIRLGVSSCLLGQEVRFDGGHKRDRFLTELLGSFVEWVPVCPELEIGLGDGNVALENSLRVVIATFSAERAV